MEIKIIIFTFLLVTVTHGFPKKLLRVPKIYNALITTNEKLLPSEAYPATTGPVFQPIGLTGEPILLNPEAFMKKGGSVQPSTPQEEYSEDENYEEIVNREQPRPFALPEEKKQEKTPTPITFYPRYSVYHPYQPFLPYSYPFRPPLLYSYGNNFDPVLPQDQVPNLSVSNPSPVKQNPVAPVLDSQTRSNVPVAPPSLPPPNTEYVKNNQPKNQDIPDVPPPPPPVGAPKPDTQTSADTVVETIVDPSSESELSESVDVEVS